MTHIYIGRYNRWFITATSPDSNSDAPDPELPPGAELLDDYTLALACLSLATKSTESPRRLRDLLLPAYHILHPPPLHPPLTYPSHKYDALRQTIVQAELILLRALGFGIYAPMAYEYLPRLVAKVLNTKIYGGVVGDSEGVRGMEDWDTYTPGEAEECGVVELMQTGLAKRAKVWVGRAAREYVLVNWYTMRTVAVACVWLAMDETGWGLEKDKDRSGGGGKDGDGDGGKEKEVVCDWVEQISNGRVDADDFWEVLKVLEGGRRGGERKRLVVP